MKKKITDHYQDKYITTPEFNTFAAHIFNKRLAQANLIAKILLLNCQVLIEKLPHINQSIRLLKMNWKRYKHLIPDILLARVILTNMVHKII